MEIAMLPYVQPVDANGAPLVDFLPETDRVDVHVLASGTAEDIDVPTGAKFCVLTADVDFYYNTNADAAVPTADVTDGTASRFAAADTMVKLVVDDVSDISVIAGAACKVTATWWGG